MGWWRWPGALLGVALIVTRFALAFFGPLPITGVDAFTFEMWLLFGGSLLVFACARNEMAPTLIRLIFVGLAAILYGEIYRDGLRYDNLGPQTAWLVAVALTVGALGGVLPRKARRLGYGVVLAFAWATLGKIWMDGYRDRSEWVLFLGAGMTFGLAAITVVYQVWSWTGRPPKVLLDELHISP